MDIPTSTGGNISTPGNKPSDEMTKDGTRIANRCSICGQEDYVTYSDGKWFLDLHTSSKNSPIVVWILSNLEGKQALDMMTALPPCCLLFGTVITGPST